MNKFETIEKLIKKKYGDVCMEGSDIVDAKSTVFPISPNLDMITGGIEEGSWVSIIGAPKIGKTTTALRIAANAQKKEYGERFIVFADVEGRLKSMNLNGIRGLKIDKEHLMIIRSEEKKMLYAADYLNIMTDVIREMPGVIVIIDSVSALCDEKIAVGGVGTQTRGSGAQLMTQFCDMMANTVRINKAVVIGMVHLGCNVSGYGSPWRIKAAERWKYQMDVVLRVKNIKPDFISNSAGETIGQQANWICDVNGRVKPNGETVSYLRYGIGVDVVRELIEQGEVLGLIEKAGAWYTLIFMSKHDDDYDPKKYKFQGVEKLTAFLYDNEDIADKLEQELVQVFK